MIKIAIVEDEAMYAKQLEEFLHQYEAENHEAFDITIYSDGDQIVNKYKSQFDIILMDVEMKFMNGMSAAEEIRKMDSEVVIIFITNMAQYAIRGYAVDALDYVLKPVSYFAFSQRLNRAIERMKKREAKVIMVNIKGGMVRINIANIYYIESAQEITCDLNKVSITYHPEVMDKVSRDAAKHFKDTYWVGRTTKKWLEIMMKDVTKASGLKELCDNLGISFDNVMAFGKCTS